MTDDAPITCVPKDLAERLHQLVEQYPPPNCDAALCEVVMRFDFADLLTRVGEDSEVAREVLSAFIEEWPILWNALQKAWEDGRANPIREAAHALKGSLANASWAYAACLAKEVEQLAKYGKLEEAAPVLNMLGNELETISGLIATAILGQDPKECVGSAPLSRRC